jgi:hypothetical protein
MPRGNKHPLDNREQSRITGKYGNFRELAAAGLLNQTFRP